jgi:hypothetical protein
MIAIWEEGLLLGMTLEIVSGAEAYCGYHNVPMP